MTQPTNNQSQGSNGPEGSADSSTKQTRIRSLALSFTLDGDSIERIPLDEALNAPLEEAKPIRGLSFYRGQSYHGGWYWSSTTGAHVSYESRLELAHLIQADFDPEVVGIVAQPFRLHWREGGKPYRHVPDYLYVLANGRRRIVNVTLPQYADRPRKVRSQRACAAAAKRLGWSSTTLGLPDMAYLRNLHLLSQARGASWNVAQYEKAILEAASRRVPIGELIHCVGQPALTKPAVLSLLWHHRLRADLSVLLNPDTLVWRSGR